MTSLLGPSGRKSRRALPIIHPESAVFSASYIAGRHLLRREIHACRRPGRISDDKISDVYSEENDAKVAEPRRIFALSSFELHEDASAMTNSTCWKMTPAEVEDHVRNLNLLAASFSQLLYWND